MQGTSLMLARWIDVPYEEVAFYCAGINHQAWFLEYRRGKENLYPRIWAATQEAGTYGEEPVRIDMMRHFGYFVTESSGHASEYVPYFRKTANMIEQELVPRFTNEADHWLDFGRTGGYLRHCRRRLSDAQKEYAELREGVRSLPTERTREYGWMILEAMELNQPARINGNVPNYGLIDNLPEGCCVEVPCLVDANGIQPTKVGPLPLQLAALNRTQVNVQELIVEASLGGDLEGVYHAVALDPLTAAVCTLPQIRAMVDEMLEAQAPWLPQFRC